MTIEKIQEGKTKRKHISNRRTQRNEKNKNGLNILCQCQPKNVSVTVLRLHTINSKTRGCAWNKGGHFTDGNIYFLGRYNNSKCVGTYLRILKAETEWIKRKHNQIHNHSERVQT